VLGVALVIGGIAIATVLPARLGQPRVAEAAADVP
jgi:hypothetical protein